MFPLSTRIVHAASKVIQAAAIFAALCAMAMAQDGMPATCTSTAHFPTWGTTYKGEVLCFVGTDPRNGPGTTVIVTPVVPIKVVCHGPAGAVVETFDPTAPLLTDKKLSALAAVLASPIFQAQDFKFDGVSVGSVQWMEASERASFWKYPGVRFDNWHITMFPLLLPPLTLDVADGDWSVDPDNHQVTVVTASVIDSFIDDQIKSGDYEGGVPIFLVYNVAEPSDRGYHHNIVLDDGFANPFMFAGYFDAPYTVTDVHSLSHEVAEFAHNPFLTNSYTPWPKSVKLPWDPPYVFAESSCGYGLEVGDPVEKRPTASKDIQIANSTMTYNFANLTLASWFMQANPSFSVNGWYTLLGAVDGEFAVPAPACPSDGLVPILDTISPDNGPLAGGTTVTLTGGGFSTKLEFDFGGSPATKIDCPNSNKCTMVTPEQKPGTVKVTVKSKDGTSKPLEFTYYVPSINGISPDSGPLEGGTTVTITGEQLSPKYEFDVDGSPVTKVDCSGEHQCTVVTPAHKPGSVKVVVKSSVGETDPVTFKYLPPQITGFTPKVGPTTGGLTIAISGDSLSDHMTVKFGTNTAKNVSCGGSSTDCLVTSPAEKLPLTLTSPAGMSPVTLTITVDGITSAPSKDEFTFAPFPTLTGISLGSGTTGDTVTLTGTNFSTVAGKTTFTFSGVPATGVTCAHETKCTAVVPGMTTQTVDVEVTVDGHTSLKGLTFTNTARLPPPPPM